MTQEQLEQIETWRESLKDRQCDEDIVNAMWLAEEMWEQHHNIARANLYSVEFRTYMMKFCMTLMEYIWMPHDVIKSITEDLNSACTMAEQYHYKEIDSLNYFVYLSYIASNDEGHDYEKHELFYSCDTKTEAEALTAILNHANKAGHDAVTRLSA